MHVEFMKNFLLADRAGWWLLDSFRPPEPKNLWFLLSRHDVCRVHENFSSRPIRTSLWPLDSIRPPEAKNVLFLLSRHGVRRFHEKISCRGFELADSCLTYFGHLSPKTFDPYFLDMMYLEFIKNFLLSDSTELLAVRLILTSWTQKRLIPTF